ncbi:MAG: methyltransferase domain-containing protein [Pseudomonadota bacterium]|nr:methyltransferase domain-containing protein [Pseudomonadota bacterium]
MTDPPRLFDRDLHRLRLNRAARGFAGAGFLKRAAAEDLASRLAAVNRSFAIAVDLGARDGGFARASASGKASGKVDFLAQADLSAAMLAGRLGARFVADEERLPLKEASVDLIVSALALHWANDLVGTLIQIRRALKPDGLFLGSLLGGATLTELRQALLEAEIDVTGGAGPRVSPFADAGDMGALLQRAGFALPVVDIDRLTVRYDHPLALMADLRAMGETSVLVERPTAPLTRAILTRAGEIYIQRFGSARRIGASFEIVTLTGWAPHPDQPKPLKPGSAKMRLADALGQVERPAGDQAMP